MRKCLVLLALLAFLPSARATTIAARSTEQMFHDSDVVAVAQVKDVRAVQHGGRIITHVVLALTEAFKGPAAGAQVEVFVPGGTVGDLMQRVEGVPKLTVGEKCVVFLSRGGGGFYRFSGLEQGKLAIEADAAGQLHVRRTITARLVDPATQQETAPPPQTEPLDPYLQTLRKLGGGAR